MLLTLKTILDGITAVQSVLASCSEPGYPLSSLSLLKIGHQKVLKDLLDIIDDPKLVRAIDAYKKAVKQSEDLQRLINRSESSQQKMVQLDQSYLTDSDSLHLEHTENLANRIDPPELKFNHQMVKEGIRMMIAGIGDDPNRSGIKETPDRVAKMYSEILNGYDEVSSIKQHVKVFDEPHSGMVIVKDIPFYSFCEHHLLPFVGKLHVAYIPKEKGGVLGLSKLIRIARVYAKQLQVQERLTGQIAESISTNIPNQGVAVTIEAEHMCMSIRGVRTPGAITKTNKLTGLFFTDIKARTEFLEGIK